MDTPNDTATDRGSGSSAAADPFEELRDLGARLLADQHAREPARLPRCCTRPPRPSMAKPSG